MALLLVGVAERRYAAAEDEQTLVDVVRLGEMLADRHGDAALLAAGQIDEDHLAQFGDLLLGVLGVLELVLDLNGEDGVRATRVLVELMRGGRAIHLALLQDGQYLVHRLDVRGEQVVDEEALLEAAAHLQLAAAVRINQISDLHVFVCFFALCVL